MPRSAPKPCTKCGAKATRRGLCARHDRQGDSHRGSARDRGYDSEHETEFRAAVLAAQPICPCGQPSTVADHYPLSRRELIRQRLNPNDPRHGRALCATCHNTHTARTQSHLGHRS
uniref:HNH endonuclease n=1 Tax=Mycobacterium Phage BigBubba TaxID=3158890 RepID=A0AAU8GP67_9CAUD